MVMDGQTLAIGRPMTQSNGRIVTATGMAMNITMKLSIHSSTSTNEVMRFQTILLNGMILIVTDGAIITLIKHGMNLEIQPGRAKLSLMLPKLINSL